MDADEIWHFYAGAPLTLSISQTAKGPSKSQTLGPDIAAGQRPQLLVPTGFWQSARSTGDYTLVGATVSPGFQFEGFDLAPKGFKIPNKPATDG